MNTLSQANLADATDHEVLAAPYNYDVIAMRYVVDEPPYGTLELTLENKEVTVVLQFYGVHELAIGAGFPHSYMGLEILDVSYLGWEHARVRVQGFEDAPGIQFWARAVTRLSE